LSFNTAFTTMTYLLVITAILSLSLAEGSPFFIIIGIGGSILSWYFVDIRSRFQLSRGFATALSVLAFLFLIVDIFYVSGFFVLSFTHFLILIQLLKLALDKEDRDYVQIYLISFMHLIVTSVLTTNIIFSILFVLYLLVATWAMLLFHLKTEGFFWLKTSGKNRYSKEFKTKVQFHGWDLSKIRNLQTKSKWFINKYFFMSTSLITIVILFLTIAIFLIFPRISAGLFMSKLGRVSKLSGFSDKVDLNSIAPLKLDFSPVMRMELLNTEGSMTKSFYIRGVAFDKYTSGTWQIFCKRDAQFFANSLGEIYPSFGGDKSWMKTIVQRYTIEELDTKVIFHIFPILNLNGKFRSVTMDSSDTIFATYPYFRGAQYTVTSGIIPKYDTTPKVFRGYMQYHASCFLDQSNITDEIRELSENITAKSGSNPFDQAMAIEKYLRDNYSYTLDNPSGGSPEPVSDFLFNTKAGHCEYFASAMVLLLRSMKIPARYVNGFVANEWNDIGSYYIIRHKDAHSWVEAFFYPIGWIHFDPTPAGFEEPSGFYGMTMNTKFGKYFDLVLMQWRKWVIDYSFDLQKLAAKKFSRKTDNLRNELFKVITIWRFRAKQLFIGRYFSLKNILWGLSGIAFFGILTHIFYKYLKSIGFFKALLKRRIRISVRFYAELIRILKRKGFKRNPFRTPYEFLEDNFSKDVPDFNSLKYITDIFYQVRYGSKILSPKELDDITDILYNLR
jgi:protein-glutamine gamma-glutamyltransferase